MKTKAVEALLPLFLDVLVDVVERMGLQSSRLMKAGGGDFVVEAREEALRRVGPREASGR